MTPSEEDFPVEINGERVFTLKEVADELDKAVSSIRNYVRGEDEAMINWRNYEDVPKDDEGNPTEDPEVYRIEGKPFITASAVERARIQDRER